MNHIVSKLYARYKKSLVLTLLLSFSGISVAFATLTFTGTSITPDSAVNFYGPIGVGSTATSTSAAFFMTPTLASTTLLIQASSSQTADLFDIASTTGALLFSVGPTGNVSTTNNFTVGGSFQSNAGQFTFSSASGTSIGIANTSTSLLLFTNASGTNLSASGYLNTPTLVTTNASSSNVSSTRIDTTGVLTVGGVLRIAAHITATSTVPGTPTTCGTSPNATGTDNAFIVTVGTGAPVACTIPFGTAFKSKPVCTVTSLNTSTFLFFQASSTASNISINSFSTTTVTNMNQVQLSVICLGID